MLFLINPTPEELVGKFDGQEYNIPPKKVKRVMLDAAAIHVQEQFQKKGVQLIYPDEEGVIDEAIKQSMMEAGEETYKEFLKEQIVNFNKLNEEQGRQGLPVFTAPKYLKEVQKILKMLDVDSISLEEPKKDAEFLLNQEIKAFEAQNAIRVEKGESPLEEPESVRKAKIALSIISKDMKEPKEFISTIEKEEPVEIQEPEVTVSGRKKSVEAAKQAKEKEKKEKK